MLWTASPSSVTADGSHGLRSAGPQAVEVQMDAVAGGLVVGAWAALQDLHVDVGMAQTVGKTEPAEARADDEHLHGVSFEGVRGAGGPR
jgi:hypothetical protein